MPRIIDLPEDPSPSVDDYVVTLDNASDITKKVPISRLSTLTTAGLVPTSRTLTASTGLSGGGDLSADRSLSLANTAVTPGSYINTNLTVDAQGRITSASNGTGGGVSESTVIAYAVALG